MNCESNQIVSRVRQTGRTRLAGSSLLLALAVGFLPGCALVPSGDYYEKRDRIVETDAHTTGQALEEHKSLMRRAHRDLLNVLGTLEALQRHRYQRDIDLLGSFVRPYLREQVDPLISSRETSWHPELVSLDANLLFAKGAVLVELGDGRAADRVIRRIESRFAGLGSMFVEYPLGTQGTLQASLVTLHERRRVR